MERSGWGRMTALFSVAAFILGGCGQSSSAGAVPQGATALAREHRASGSSGVKSTHGGTPATRGPKCRDNTDPSDGQSPGGYPATIGDESMGGCDSQPVVHQCVL